MGLFTSAIKKLKRNKIMIFKLNKSKVLVFLLFLFTVVFSSAQQDPMFTQYHFNTQTFNPAYAGTWESMGFLVLGRHQWAGIEGAPETYTFSMQSNTKNDKVGLGLNLISDQIGMEKRHSLFADYSYGFKVAEESMLRLGLKAGVSNYRNNLSGYRQYPGEPDPSLMGEPVNYYIPNFGVGAFLLSDNYYVGFSIPKILENSIEDNHNNLTHTEIRQYYLIAGYVFHISEYLQFKPTFLTKATLGAPVQLDFTANFLLGEKVWLGAMYRTGDAIGFIAQWIFDKKLRIGYAYDYTTSQLSQFNTGTHEVMVSYEIGVKRKWSKPRMF
jgi:type IX secretion system PorP/SprF family membrane protein